MNYVLNFIGMPQTVEFSSNTLEKQFKMWKGGVWRQPIELQNQIK